VYDMTAGFARDAVILASGGAGTVVMVERDPIVGIMLEDALRRLEMVASLEGEGGGSDDVVVRARVLLERLVLYRGDGATLFTDGAGAGAGGDGPVRPPRPDVCYLDPMFPPRRKSAAVKKPMRILHGLFQPIDGADVNASCRRRREEGELLKAALSLARRRVVVKRPVGASPLGVGEGDTGGVGVRMPSYELKGSVNRFDVYVISA